MRYGCVLFNFRWLEIFKACQLWICLGFYAVQLSWIFASVFLFLHESAAALRGNRKDALPLSNCLRTHCVTVGLPACLYVNCTELKTPLSGLFVFCEFLTLFTHVVFFNRLRIFRMCIKCLWRKFASQLRLINGVDWRKCPFYTHLFAFGWPRGKSFRVRCCCSLILWQLFSLTPNDAQALYFCFDWRHWKSFRHRVHRVKN